MTKGQYLKIGRGILIAAAGAALTVIADSLPGVDFGAYTPIVFTISSTVINAAREYLKTV